MAPEKTPGELDRPYLLGTNVEELVRLGLQHRVWRGAPHDPWERGVEERRGWRRHAPERSEWCMVVVQDLNPWPHTREPGSRISTDVHERVRTATDAGFHDFRDPANVRGRPSFPAG